MKTPINRREFENHINILKEAIEGGRYIISRQFNSFDSFSVIKNLPNKRLDVSSVDDNVRTIANTYATILINNKKNEKNDSDIQPSGF